MVYKENSTTGNFTFLNVYSTLVISVTTDVDNSSKIQNAGHLAITDDGQYILCSNRGILNSIVVFRLKDSVNGSNRQHEVYNKSSRHEFCSEDLF
uniref:Uncharacterized protein n=1 Tax=Acrobeloides nanus TaxID=290746 RepID=A0A914EGA3_9BILA